MGRFEEERDGSVYHWFEYGIIPLADLDATEFIDSANPVAHGLMGFYRRKGLDAVWLKAESLRQVAHLTSREPALLQILLVALERYFVLTDEQQGRLTRMLARPGYEEVREVLSLTEERGMLKEAQYTLLDQMRERFGEVPEDVETIVRGMKSTEELRPYLRKVVRVRSLDEMGFPPNGRPA